MSKPTASGVKPMTMVASAITPVDSSSGMDARLCTNGVFAVRIMWMTNTCDSVPNTNHPHWNSGESAAVFLRMQGDLFRRLRLHRLADTRGNIRLTSPVEAARYAVSQLSLNTYETVLAVCLNAKKAVQSCERVVGGSLSEAQIYPRNIAESALLHRAHGILLIHNHPSGDPTPSKADVETTESVRAALESIGVQLFDHIIVGGEHAYSFSTGAVIGVSGAEAEVFSLLDYQALQAQAVRTGALLRVMEPY